MNKIFILLMLFSYLVNLEKAQANDKKSYVMMRLGYSINKGTLRPDNDPILSEAVVQHDKGAAIGGSIGYSITPEWRLALSMNYLPKWKVTYQRQPNNDRIFYQSYINSLSATIDNYYDITNLSFNGVTPYILGGIGISVNEIADGDYFINNDYAKTFYRHSSTNLAWKIGAGITYKINDSVFVESGYSFTHLGKVESKIAKDSLDENFQQVLSSDVHNQFKKLHSHQFSVGLGLRF